MFDLRRLRLLHELSLRGTLAAVAEALSYSPSTISQQLSLLEREAGVPLLEPDGRRLRLTAQGAALAAHAGRMLAADEAARAELERLRPSLAPVRVAVMQSAAHGLLPRALDALAESEPQLRVEVAELAPEEGLFEVAARGFDLAVAEQYPGHTREHLDGIERSLLGRDAIRLAVARDDPAANLGDLRERAWVMEPVGTAARQWATQQCRAAGFEPDVRFEMADLTAHVRLVASGHAVSLIPDLVFAGDRPPVQLVDLPGEPRREVFTAVRRGTADRPGVRAVRAALQVAYDRGDG
ncbi:LysR family transcriptional regulator [Microbacterium trichothecenolyticum]|uniref:DNA-binding transcriptional LysR family regulator n=1 Tax=Microbacterium trichothecenolyticum TaxID=69370 RepID=A0ABU0TY70_MICTR|nr:LysR family transcriptional regulator [Microbacterium trichothecenolyticum]MDQ1124601.1 DNA-binding transcriptional LysR family regulator [Microbacterium trichothecenolyticum]